MTDDDLNHTIDQLQDLNLWVRDLPRSWSDLPPKASRMGDGIHVRISHTAMPGGMERAVDTWEQNGALGIHTQVGVQQALGPIADEIRATRAALIGTDPPQRTIPYLIARLNWAWDHMPLNWQHDTTADINIVWRRVKHLTRPDRETEGTCPHCGRRLQWVMGSEGRVEMPLCPSGHKVDARGGLQRAQRRRLAIADADDKETVVTLQEARKIWPNLNASTIRSLVHRGQLERVGERPSRYRLADINQAMRKGA